MTEAPPAAGQAQWTCHTCGKVHEGLATLFGADTPQPWSDATDDERASGQLTDDQCEVTIAGTTFYFLRGFIDIPVTDSDIGPFIWSVWVSVSLESIDTMGAHWYDADRASLPPFFGWLSSVLPYEPPTVNLATNVHTRPPGLVPLIEVDPTLDHPLVREQVEGITMHRLAELNRQLWG